MVPPPPACDFHPSVLDDSRKACEWMHRHCQVCLCMCIASLITILSWTSHVLRRPLLVPAVWCWPVCTFTYAWHGATFATSQEAGATREYQARHNVPLPPG